MCIYIYLYSLGSNYGRSLVYCWDKIIVLPLADPPLKPFLSPLSLSATIVISSCLPLRLLVHYHRCLHLVLLISHCFLGQSHHHHSALILRHSSAGHRHRVITSCLPSPSPLVHNAPFVCHQSHHRLSSTKGGPPLASPFIASCPPPLSSHIRQHPHIRHCHLLSPLLYAAVALSHG